MIKAVIFDMDGVIIDSEPLHYKVFKEYLHSKWGMSITDEEYSTFIGATNYHMYAVLKEKYQLAEEVTALVEEYEEKCSAYLTESKTEKPILGVDVLVKNLYQNNIRLALASSSPKKNIKLVLEMFGLAPYFEVVVSGQEVVNSKPSPDIFLRAAKLLNLLPEECLVFEDSKNGVAAAKEAGMKCIAFYNPNSGKQDLSRADHIIESFAEVDSTVTLAK